MGWQRDADGHLIISETYGHFEQDAAWKGFLVQASGIDTDTFHDYQIDTQIYIKGGQYWSIGGQIGDYAEASVVDKDDILGLFDLYGLVSGVDVLELFKFAETLYINPNGTDMCMLDSPDSALVYPGLHLRIKVHTTTDTGIDIGVKFLWFEE
jgi:hypothetical protein